MDENGESVEQKILQAAPQNGGGRDLLKVTSPIALNGAEILVVNVNHPGYTSYSRRLVAEEAIYLNAELLGVEAITVAPTQSTSISGTAIDGFALSVPAMGNEGDIFVAIPRSLVPEGTTNLIAEIRSFDPNDPVDAQNFPGAYADTDGNNLVSVAFNFADIRTTDGQDLGALVAARAQQKLSALSSAAEAEEAVIINRNIPAASCATLRRLGDSNAAQAGFQIPVYSYDSGRGLWELLGHGTVYAPNGTPINSVGDDCEDGEYVLEIAVTSQILASDWWNLDYPLIFSEPVKYCAQIQLQNEDQQPLNGRSGFIYGTAGDFVSHYFVSDKNGAARIEVEAADIGDTISASVSIIDERIFTGEVVLSRNCASPQVQVVTVDLPRLCQVYGKLAYPDGSPATRHPVMSLPTEWRLGDYFDFTGTDANGEYWVNATCEKNYTVSAYSLNKTFEYAVNVDGTVAGDEQADSGEMVTLPTATVDPIPTTLQPAVYSTVDKKMLLFVFGHSDNFPMTYQLTIQTPQGQTLDTVAGEIQRIVGDDDDTPFWYGVAMVEIALDADIGNSATLAIKGSIKDSHDKMTPVDTVILVVHEPLNMYTDE